MTNTYTHASEYLTTFGAIIKSLSSEVGPGIGPPPKREEPIITFLQNFLKVLYYVQFVLLAILIIYVAVRLIKAAIRSYKNRSASKTLPYYVKMLRILREENYKTQQEIAYILGISPTMYASYEKGTAEIKIRHLIILCKYYKVSADRILGTDSSDQR